MNSESCFGVFFRLCVLPQCIFTQKTCIDNGCESPSEKYDDLENTGFIEDLLQSLGVSFSELLGFGVEDDCAATPFLSSCDMRVSLSKKIEKGGEYLCCQDSLYVFKSYRFFPCLPPPDFGCIQWRR